MFEKMSDGDVMVYLQNAALQMAKVCKERNVDIHAHICPDGYISMRAGDYEILRIEESRDTAYKYRPLSRTEKWKDNIDPQSIRFSGEPEEEEHGQ